MATRKPTKSEQLQESEGGSPGPETKAWVDIAHKIVDWLIRQGYWKAIGGAVILIFAWHMARHYFPG
jgi:hypothetical protein